MELGNEKERTFFKSYNWSGGDIEEYGILSLMMSHWSFMQIKDLLDLRDLCITFVGHSYDM